MAAVTAVQHSAKVLRIACDAAGTSAIRRGCVLERLLREASCLTRHMRTPSTAPDARCLWTWREGVVGRATRQTTGSVVPPFSVTRLGRVINSAFSVAIVATDAAASKCANMASGAVLWEPATVSVGSPPRGPSQLVRAPWGLANKPRQDLRPESPSSPLSRAAADAADNAIR